MSKSLGNHIRILASADDMYGKVMSIPDRLMGDYWSLVTDADAGKLSAVRRQLALATTPDGFAAEELKRAGGSVNPMAVKKDLARTIVRMYHGADAADSAERDFEAQFSRRGTPEHLEEFGPDALAAALGHAPAAGIVEFLVASGIAASKSAARRLIEQNAVSVDGERVSGLDFPIDATRTFVLRAGKRMMRFRPLGQAGSDDDPKGQGAAN
jgi:tyrosyl-tRNA synthetase